MNCYLSRNYKGLSSAGNKAKTDIEQIMKDLSFKNVGLKQTTYRNKVLSFLFTLAGVLKATCNIGVQFTGSAGLKRLPLMGVH